MNNDHHIAHPPLQGDRGQASPSLGGTEGGWATDRLASRGICVVIPTYNNASTIARVVAEAQQQCRDVIVVNDGSTDSTTDILRGIEGITLLEHDRNRGKGHALRTAFWHALEQGFAYAITIDADGQHYASDIGKFLQANIDHPGALIVGQRNLEGVERTPGSDFANKFSNFWFWVQTGRRLEDTQTGYRLYPLKKLRGLSLLTSRYEAELEMMVLASWHGVELVSIPIDVYYPPREERVTHFRPGIDFARITTLNTVLCFLAVVYGLPLRLWRWAMKYLRTAYAVTVFVFFAFCVVTPLVWFYVKVGKMTERKKRNLHLVIQFIPRFIMLHHGMPGAKFTQQVDPSDDFDRPHIVICNHQSHLDLPCQLIFTPNIVFITNDWVYNNPSYGFLIRHADYIAVSNGLDEQLPKMRELVKKGYNIAIFPEGTRRDGRDIGRFHQGAFHLAQELGVDIMPMYLYGTGRVLPKKTYLLRPWRIHIEVGPAITRQQLEAMGDTLAQARTVRHHYQERYRQITDKIEQDV